MAKKPEPPKPTWTIYKIAAKQTWVGNVQAADEREAIQKAAEVSGNWQRALCGAAITCVACRRESP